MQATETTYRQGDVLIKKIDRLPEGAQGLDSANGTVVLARGTATGHTHRFSSEHATEFRTEDGQRFLELKEGAQLVHEEHDTITPEPGLYEIVQQREYTPDEVRNVAD